MQSSESDVHTVGAQDESPREKPVANGNNSGSAVNVPEGFVIRERIRVSGARACCGVGAEGGGMRVEARQSTSGKQVVCRKARSTVSYILQYLAKYAELYCTA
eukprot:GFKZ01012203.1.p3 GENE.GFKZ01012203.1~~GFKZ01012203.1.p3  ORF type:complete len:103 (+),score=3.69 GFKZ01012203.1:399-707(+)